MTDYSPLFTAAEQKYDLPPGILAATAQVESSGNPRAVSPQGAQGLMQIMPATAQGLGVNPLDPVQAIDGAGRTWSQNLKAAGGDIDRAAMMYHGGTDPRQWGPKTQAYPHKLAAALGPTPAQEGGDPIEAALSGQPAAQPQTQAAPADANDPIESALAHGIAQTNAAQNPVADPNGAGNQSGSAGNSVPDNASGRVVPGNAPGDAGGQAGTQAPGLQPHQVGIGTGLVDAAGTGLTAGIIHPLTAALNTVIPLDKLTNPNVKSVWDTSLPEAFRDNLAIERATNSNFRDQHPALSVGADLAGAIASPFNKLFAAQEGTGFLGSIPNMMLQGATYGGIRGTADTGTMEGAATGAGLGEALGPVGGAIGTVAGKAIGAVLRGRSTLANAIPQSLKHQIAGMIDSGASVDQIHEAIPQSKEIANIPNWVQFRAKGGKGPIAWGDIPSKVEENAPDTEALAAAVKAHTAPANDDSIVITGHRRGIESVSKVPAPVAQDTQRLLQAEVSPEEAAREADIRYVGGKPTVAAVTRDPQEQMAFNEGAKLDPQLNAAQAENNAAIHATTANTIEGYGGVPAQGDATQSAAEALAKASDASRARVNAKYTAARAQDGDVKINTDELRELLQSPEMATPTSPQVQQLSNGILSHLRAVDQRVGTTLRTPEEIEQIRQLANSAYDPMGGSVNNAVGKIGAALNDGLDQLDQASAAWRAARAAHRDWASQYSDPAGISKLIARDAHGNFIHADQWRLAENGLVSRLNDKPFAQAIGQLKKIGATDALNKLKANIVQQAYEKATNSARDSAGNPVFNGKLFQQELTRIGMPKIEALFEPDEVAHLATIGRAARHLNEPVPGTLNTSNTAAAITHSSLAAALKAKPGKHPVFTALKLGSAAMGHIPAAVAIHGAEHLSNRSAQGAIQQGIREQLNTGLARAMAQRSQSRIANDLYRQQVGRALRSRGAVSGADPDNRRALAKGLQNALQR